MRTKLASKQSFSIAPWNSYSLTTSEWHVNGYLFVLEQHQINQHIHYVLYSKDCPQVRLDSTCISIPTGANKEYIVTLLATRKKLVYDMYVKFNINNWEYVNESV